MYRKKEFLAMILFACVLCCSSFYAEAETEWSDYRTEDEASCVMEVVNCQEWVSLREDPDVNSARLAKIPLGAFVYDCVWYSDEFIYGEYGGQYGYILSDYLAWCEYGYADGYEYEYGDPGELWNDQAYFMPYILSYDELRNCGTQVLDCEAGDFRIMAFRQCRDEEVLYVACFDDEMEAIWGYVTGVGYVTELDATAAFIGGTGEEPRVMIYNTEIGLYMIEPETGEIEWEVSSDEISLTGSVCYAVDEEGTMYLAGFYGPDPIAVSMDGTVLWESDAEDEDIYWPYAIHIMDENIIVDYESGNEYGHYVVAYGPDGTPEWTDISLY